MNIEKIDHIVLTVKNIDETCEFYHKVLGMEIISFAKERKALKFGGQKINLHKYTEEIEPKALNPTPGSADLCFVTSHSLTEVINHIQKCGIDVVEGPVERTGAVGKIMSVYIRDVDNNLIEIAKYKTNKE